MDLATVVGVRLLVVVPSPLECWRPQREPAEAIQLVRTVVKRADLRKRIILLALAGCCPLRSHFWFLIKPLGFQLCLSDFV